MRPSVRSCVRSRHRFVIPAAVALAGLVALATVAVRPAPAAGDAKFQYPPATRQGQVDEYHGTKVPDPYRWLEDVDSPETRRWVAAENELTFGYLRGLPARARLKARLTELWDYPRYGVPFKAGGRYFFTRNDGLQNQPVLYVQESLDAAPRPLLDANALSADGTVAVSATAVSDDGRLLAYGLARAGSDWQEIRVRAVPDGAAPDGAAPDGADRPDVLEWVKFGGPAWTKDGRGFFYPRFPEPAGGDPALRAANRDQRVYYHVVGTPQADDRLVYARPDDPRLLVGLSVSDDGRFAVIHVSRGGSKNAVAYVDLKDPMHPEVGGPAVALVEDFDASWDFVDSVGTVLYFRTDAGAPNGRVAAADVGGPGPVRWETPVPESADALTRTALVGGRLVAVYLHDAASRVRVLDPAGRAVRDVGLPELGTATQFRGRAADDEAFFAFTSYLRPATVYRYDVRAGTATEFHAPKVKFDPSPYETRQVWATGKDGTKVPAFVTCRKGLKLDGSHPVYLTAYGGFKIPTTPAFSVPSAAWLEAGGVLAVANPRGGGEFGEAWHAAGTRLNKQRVFDDFIAVAEHLVREGYTKPGRLAVMGGSNGGLLVGAVVNQRPDLFGAAVPAVGVMDMLRFHRFTIGSAWVEEYGSSDDPEQFKALYAYSPLHNVRPGAAYPPTLVLTADHDDRVVPGHSFKYAAALQAAQAGPAPVLIRVETAAGHGGGKPTGKAIDEAADVYAFIMHHLGMDGP